MIGAHVTYSHDGRELLGEVVGVDGDRLLVRHFNREPWPVSPRASDVAVLMPTYDEPDDDE